IAVRRDGPVEVANAIRNGTASNDVLEATRNRAPGANPYLDLDAAQRRGIRLVVPESDDWPHFALACLEATGDLRAKEYARGQRAAAERGELIPPLALWARGPLDLSSIGTR